MPHSYFYEIRNQPSALQRLSRELDSTLSRDVLDPDVRTTVLLVIDELVSNLLKYGFQTVPDQRSYLKIEIDADVLQIELKDNGRPFNPLVRAEPNSLGQGLPDRPVGGLGVYLVLKMMDEMQYEWSEPWNCLKLRKNLKRALR
jgi:anti-sigma regulatory factor (Ser/Thr protein kinase)